MSTAQALQVLRLGLAFALIGLTGCGKPPAPAPAPVVIDTATKPPIALAQVPDGVPPLPPKPATERRDAAQVARLIPADALGFVAVNVRDLWNSPEGWEVRRLAAGEERDIFHHRHELISPEFIDYYVLMTFDAKESPLHLVFASNPYLKRKIKNFSMPERANVREEEYKGKKMLVRPLATFSEVGQTIGGPPVKEKPKPKPREVPTIALLFLDDMTFVEGSAAQVRAWIDHSAKSAEGPLSSARKKVADRHHIVAAVAPATARQMEKELPPNLQPILKATSATLVVDAGKQTRAKLDVSFPDEKAATEGEAAVKTALSMLQLAMPNAIEEVDRDPDNLLAHRVAYYMRDFEKALKGAAPKRSGSAIEMAVTIETDLSKPPSEDPVKLEEARNRKRHARNMKEIGLAFHNFESTFGSLPPAAICDKDGKPLLSWRVLILPYVEEDGLYRQFKFDEAWDSPHNKKLMERMPKVYQVPGVKTKEAYLTHYQLFVGQGAIYDGKLSPPGVNAPGVPVAGLRALGSPTIANIPDGTSNTILVAEASEGVPWTKPDDLPYDAKKPLPKLGALFANRFLVVMADGSVHWVSNKVTETTLRAAITAAGGEVLGSDWPDGK